MSKYQYRPPCGNYPGVQYYWMLDLEMYVHRVSHIVLHRRDSWKLFFIIGIRTSLLCPMEKKLILRATLYGQRTEFIDIHHG
ncbi:MAG: hypothetical protein ACLUDU_23150 [Butyricimonas faecihominis]